MVGCVSAAPGAVASNVNTRNSVARISHIKAIHPTKPASPDITATGVNFLAEWSPSAAGNTTRRSIDYVIILGTSMSCPHISVLVAIISLR
ncbi:hypothetical protein AAHA92_21331 [Salvia divinorum]|uniref:Peptidase S8/S53 domain-containing protein n=1 Tax=Salvia divinorum TaxID=28513 RepID=A0ABD1GK30_SALDI